MRLNEINAPVDEIPQASTRQLVLRAMFEASPLLRLLEFYTHTGNADTPPESASQSAGATREINADFTGNNTGVSTQTKSLIIFGDKIRTDRAHQRRNTELPVHHLNRVLSAARNIALNFEKMLLNGKKSDGEALNFDGLLTLFGTQANLSTRQKTYDKSVPLGNTESDITSRAIFLEELNRLAMYAGNTGAILCNSDTKLRIISCARDYVSVVRVQDALGATYEQVSINGVPLVPVGNEAEGSEISNIPISEDRKTSMLALRFGEERDVTVATSPAGVQVITTPNADNFIQTRIEFDAVPYILNPHAAFLLKDIIIPNALEVPVAP